MKVREYIQVRKSGIIPDSVIDPTKLQVVVEVDDGQVFTLPTINNFSGTTFVYNYTVDWGDQSPVNTITTYNSANRVHTYTLGGQYIITIDGVFPCWYTNNDAQIKLLITRVLSWGDTGLKLINFYGCSALVRLPDLPNQMGKLPQVMNFANFCNGCSSLTAIPHGVFYGNTLATDFSSVFGSCQKLKTLPETLFRDNINIAQFSSAFYNCVKLESIPALLFSTNTKATYFNACFYGCSTLTSIPATLFQNNTANYSTFSSIFYYCSSLTQVPVGLFTNVRSQSFSECFASCANLTTIPQDLFKGQSLCSSFYRCFYYCPKLTGVPSGVFDLHVAGTNLCTNMQECFLMSGTDASVTVFTVANNLFDQLTKVQYFDHTFSGCSKLEVIPDNFLVNCVAAISFTNTFAGTKISVIPNGLFSSCTEATTFLGTFSSCTYLTSAGIPSNLFQNCTKALYFGNANQGYYYYGVFYNCTNAGFTSIPAGLFDSCVNAISFQGAFYGTKITSIPTDLLRYCTAVINVDYMFYGTSITSAGSNIFQYNRQITSVRYCFANCLSLTTVDEAVFHTYGTNTNAITDFEGCFQYCSNVGFTSIPENIFRYSVNAKNFNSAFYGCTKLTSIPAGLFQYNTIAEYFHSTFYNCNAIASIPATLFSGLTAVKSFQACFYNCWALTAIPAGLFDSQGLVLSVNWVTCFYTDNTTTHNLITSAVPDLWNKPNSPVGTQCFLNRTAISNYASIPANWK